MTALWFDTFADTFDGSAANSPAHRAASTENDP